MKKWKLLILLSLLGTIATNNSCNAQAKPESNKTSELNIQMASYFFGFD